MSDELEYPEDETNELQCDMFGFCACGRPEENLRYILGGLEILNDQFEDNGDGKWYERHRGRVDEYFASAQAEYFFWYWCAKEELTEHGCGVPGWLTARGKAALDRLRRWKQMGRVVAA